MALWLQLSDPLMDVMRKVVEEVAGPVVVVPAATAASAMGSASCGAGSVNNRGAGWLWNEIGRCGEDCVFEELNRAYPVERGFTVKWINKNRETGLPFDVVVSSGEDVEIYVEVKATMFEVKREFEISARELLFAFLNGSKYAIYRVFNVYHRRGYCGSTCKSCYHVVPMYDPMWLLKNRWIQLVVSSTNRQFIFLPIKNKYFFCCSGVKANVTIAS
jgi:hypothetical protein